MFVLLCPTWPGSSPSLPSRLHLFPASFTMFWSHRPAFSSLPMPGPAVASLHLQFLLGLVSLQIFAWLLPHNLNLSLYVTSCEVTIPAKTSPHLYLWLCLYLYLTMSSIKNESIICQNVRSLRAEADLFTSMYPIPSTVPDKYLLTDWIFVKQIILYDINNQALHCYMRSDVHISNILDFLHTSLLAKIFLKTMLFFLLL